MSFIEFRNISKFFGRFPACENVSLLVKKGCVHAIIGENGAGKSTLVKLLGGIEKPTAGTLWLEGNAYQPESAQDAFKNKIAFIHQHFVLASQLTALDNLVLSATADSSPLKNKSEKTVHQAAEQLLKKFGWHIPLKQLVSRLSVGEQQRLEIVKALMQNPEIIIFDEPTAVLTPQEAEELIKFILQLKSEGKTIILISHKLHEIKNVADTVSVLRQGKLIATRPINDLSVDEMAEMMIGRRVVKNNSINRAHAVQVSFKHEKSGLEFYKSEIFGVAGVEGNGQSELIADLLQTFRKKNLSYGDITEDRIHLSVFEGLNLKEHVLIKYKNKFTKNLLVNFAALAKATHTLVTEWDVRPPDINKSLSEFSGGNQQKFVVGRELMSDPDVLLAAHPTRGVDLGAQENIHNALLNYSKKDKTVVLVSSDLDEVLFLADRFIVLSKNKIHGPFKKGQLSETEIGLYMAGHTI